MNQLTTIRRSVSLKTRDLELPECFQVATVNAALNAQERQTVSAKVSRRRLLEKATKIAGMP